MSIHEHLPPEAKRKLKQVGWTKGLELAKLARRRDGQEFDCTTWLHKAKVLPKEEFQREVEKELTGQDSEPWELFISRPTRARSRFFQFLPGDQRQAFVQQIVNGSR